MFSEYLCHGWKPETRLYYCSKGWAGVSLWMLCFYYPEMFPPHTHRTVESIMYTCVLLLFPGSGQQLLSSSAPMSFLLAAAVLSAIQWLTNLWKMEDKVNRVFDHNKLQFNLESLPSWPFPLDWTGHYVWWMLFFNPASQSVLWMWQCKRGILNDLLSASLNGLNICLLVSESF